MAFDQEGALELTRACALFTLGTVQSVAARPTLEIEAREGSGLIRRAAILGLGEYRDRIFDGEDILRETLLDVDASPELKADALLALGRTGDPKCRRELKSLQGQEGNPLAASAGDVLAFLHIYEDGKRPEGPIMLSSVSLLLDLRFESAKRFGTVGGAPWAQTQLNLLGEDDGFLDEVVLMAAARSGLPGVRDHLFEMLLQPGRAVRWRAGVRILAPEIEAMIARGLGGPETPQEWTVLVDSALEFGLAQSMPATMERALGVKSVAVSAAAQLVGRRPELSEQILSALSHPKESVRVRACQAVGRQALAGYLIPLRKLSLAKPDAGKANSMRVRSAAWVARLRLGDVSAKDDLHAVLVDPLGVYTDSDRATVYEALEFACLTKAVAGFIVEEFPETRGGVQSQLQALLARSGHALPGVDLREAYGNAERNSTQARRILRGLTELPSAEDLAFLADEFPLAGDYESNVLLAQVLIDHGHAKIEPLLRAAAWSGPWHRSVLVGAVVTDSWGVDLLMHWVSSPPPEVRSLDIRRLGFSIGEWGGLAAIEDLRAQLGAATGADRPALQGALLGALTTRTH